MPEPFGAVIIVLSCLCLLAAVSIVVWNSPRVEQWRLMRAVARMNERLKEGSE